MGIRLVEADDGYHGAKNKPKPPPQTSQNYRRRQAKTIVTADEMGKVKMKKSLPRLYDYLLALNLEATGAVLVEGAKWCGKMTTCEQVAGSVVYLQDPAVRDQNVRLARFAPKVLLEGATPRLIDEWQLAPVRWSK